MTPIKRIAASTLIAGVVLGGLALAAPAQAGGYSEAELATLDPAAAQARLDALQTAELDLRSAVQNVEAAETEIAARQATLATLETDIPALVAIDPRTPEQEAELADLELQHSQVTAQVVGWEEALAENEQEAADRTVVRNAAEAAITGDEQAVIDRVAALQAQLTGSPALTLADIEPAETNAQWAVYEARTSSWNAQAVVISHQVEVNEANGVSTVPTGDSLSWTVATDEDGLAHIPAGSGAALVTSVVTEFQAPAGYVLDSTPVTTTVEYLGGPATPSRGTATSDAEGSLSYTLHLTNDAVEPVEPAPAPSGAPSVVPAPAPAPAVVTAPAPEAARTVATGGDLPVLPLAGLVLGAGTLLGGAALRRRTVAA